MGVSLMELRVGFKPHAPPGITISVVQCSSVFLLSVIYSILVSKLFNVVYDWVD